MSKRTIIDSPQQSLYGQPSVQFRPNDFNAAIWSHGYDIICEKAVRCPCQGNGGAPLPDCQNCHGFGYFFINPTRTKALITGLNKSTNYVQWSPELIGTAAITVRDEDKELISYFNRVTLEDEYAVFTEMALARGIEGSTIGRAIIESTLVVGGRKIYFCFLTYAPTEIESIYLYKSSGEPLIKLSEGDYMIPEDSPYCVVFVTDEVAEDVGVSVTYRHRVEYHIIDLPHEIRASLGKNKLSGQFEILKMPIQGIGRRSHLVLNKPDFWGEGVIYNDDVR